MLEHKKDIVVILANQRSGTTALGLILKQHPEIEHFGEIFYSNQDFRQDYNFIYFLGSKIKEDLEYFYKFILGGFETEIFQDFLNYLIDKYNIINKKILFDIKFNNTHLLNGGWHFPLETPKLINILKNHKAKFIFLKRNLLRCYLSELVAKHTGLWHIYKEVNPKNKQEKFPNITVNINEAFNRVKLLYNVAKFYENILNDYEFVLSVKYQNLFNKLGIPNNEKLIEIWDFLGINPNFLPNEPMTEKIIKKLDFIENLEEVLSYFKKFEWFREMETIMGTFEEF